MLLLELLLELLALLLELLLLELLVLLEELVEELLALLEPLPLELPPQPTNSAATRGAVQIDIPASERRDRFGRV